MIMSDNIPYGNTFSKAERLVGKKYFDALFENGQSFSAFPLRIKYRIIDRQPSENEPTLFAVSVPKRHFKKAVDRNLIKRRIRESYRLSKKDLRLALSTNSKQLSVLVVYIGKDVADYAKINKQMNVLIKHLINEI